MAVLPPLTQQTSATTQSDRRRLVVARVGWVIGSVIGVASFSAGIPATFAALHEPCLDAASQDCSQAQLSLADFRALGGTSVAANNYAIYGLVVLVAASLVFFAVGGLIASRKWNDPTGLFFSLVLITFAATGVSDTFMSPSGLVFVLAQFALVIAQYPLLAAFLLTFPTGRFAPRWSAILVPVWFAQTVLFVLGPPDVVLAISAFLTWGSAGAIQLYRYVRLYTPTQRQQTKWVVFSIVVLKVCLLLVAYNFAPLIWPDLNTPGSLFRLANVAVLAVSWMPISLGVGIAILRFRLFDIDVIIRRTLLYGALTTLLAAVYVVSVIVSQALSRALTGQRDVPPVVIVISTLLIAALFNPLRLRLQSTIDRRFYRRKYDAERTLAAFAATLREQVDLPQVTDHLLQAVDETMQPAQVSLWLRVPDGRR